MRPGATPSRGCLAERPGLVEAHLPQFYCEKVASKPAQVLVMVTKKGFPPDQLLKFLGTKLLQILPEGEILDVWPLDETDRLLKNVRNANCRIV